MWSGPACCLFSWLAGIPGTAGFIAKFTIFAAAAVARWSQALAIPQVRGFVAGRSLLFPSDGDVDRAVASVAEALGRGGA